MADEGERKGVRPSIALAVIAGVVTAAAMVGRRKTPAPDHPRTKRWYDALEKPGFTPPPPVFAIAWPIIETSLAYGAYRLLRRPRSPARDSALAMLVVHQAGLAGWNTLFFGKRELGAGTAAVGALGVLAGGYVAVAAREDRVAAATALPLVAWLGFATVLAGAVWRLNPDEGAPE